MANFTALLELRCAEAQIQLKVEGVVLADGSFFFTLKILSYFIGKRFEGCGHDCQTQRYKNYLTLVHIVEKSYARIFCFGQLFCINFGLTHG